MQNVFPRRVQLRYYHHGVRYLKKLGTLTPAVVDWRGIIFHAEYKQKVIDAHGHKRGFWSKCEMVRTRVKRV